MQIAFSSYTCLFTGKAAQGFVAPARRAAAKNQPHFQGDITVTMKKGSVGRILGALLALALVSCFDYSATWARDADPEPASQQEQIGAIKRILGTVSIRRAGESRPQPARENAAVFLQDTLRTDRDGKAWWRSNTQRSALLQGDASLGNSSALEFVRFDQDGSSSDFSGEVGQGMVRFIRDLPKSTPRSHFIISTPTAIIEVLSTDRPADFVVEVSKDQKLTTVYGVWGAVKVKQLFAEFVQERIVRSCQRVDVEEDKEPQPVIRVSPETLTELIRKTTIPKTLPEEVPSCQDSTVAEVLVIDEEPPYVLGPPVIDEEPPYVRCPCPPGQELIGDGCETCPRWKKYSRRTCSCVSRCRSDKQCRRCETCRNGLCVPIHKKCPPGQTLDKKTCTCVECPPVECKEGFWFNPKTCGCERKQPCDKKCPPGQKLDERTCTCVGECRPIHCQEGFWFNPQTCRCERKQPCDKKCPPGQKLDEKACACVGECTPIDCKEGFWFNPQTCRCERKQPCDKKCPPGQKLDEKTCTCVGECTPIDCKEGYWFNPKTCNCERKQACDKKCPQGQVLDPRTCECTQRPTDCNRKCPPGQHLDVAACKCVGDVTVPRKGCASDGECGPGSACRNGICVPKEGHPDRVQPSKPDREQPRDHVQPSKPDREQPRDHVQPSRPDREQPAERAQPQQKRDQRQ